MYLQSPKAQAGAPAISTQTLLAHVLGITGSGFLITAAAAYVSSALGLPVLISIGAMLVGFGFLIAIHGTRANPSMSLLMFYLFTVCEGLGISPVIATYLRQPNGYAVVIDAASTTGLGMLTLAAVVHLTSFDYRKLSGIAFGALVVLLIVGLISAFTHFLHPGTYAWLTLGVFTLLVLVDFARIRAGGDGQSAIEMATSIYLDGINIFLALLQIFGGRRRA